MAKKGQVDKALRLEMLRLNVLLFLMGIMVVLVGYLLTELAREMTLTFGIGAVLIFIGMILVVDGVHNRNMTVLAMASTIQFVGAAIGTMWLISLENILLLFVPMVLGPLALGQYQLGTVIINIRSFVEAEGVDYYPVVKDFHEYMSDHIRALGMYLSISMGLSFLAIVVVYLLTDVLSVNSTILMAILLGLILTCAPMLWILKGGRTKREEEGRAQPASPEPQGTPQT